MVSFCCQEALLGLLICLMFTGNRFDLMNLPPINRVLIIWPRDGNFRFLLALNLASMDTGICTVFNVISFLISEDSFSSTMIVLLFAFLASLDLT